MILPAQPRRLLRIAWFLALLAVIAGELLPGASLPVRLLTQLHIGDKIQHFGAYAVLAFLPTLHERRGLLAIVALGLVALGISLEFGQMLSGSRFLEIGDMAANAVGVCFGVAFGLPLRNALS